MSRSPCPVTKYTLGCWPCTTLISPLVRSCSASDVTRCTRPSYSSTIVPSAFSFSFSASDGRFSGSMYSTCSCLRHVLVFLEARPEALEVFGARKDRGLDRLGQALQHLLGLVRQRVLARRRQVPPLVVPLGQVVDGRQNGQDDEHARRRERAVARLPAREIARDLAPLAEHVEQDADEAADGESVPPSPFRPQVPNRDRGEDEGDAQPAQESEKSFQHMSSVLVSRVDLSAPAFGVHRLGGQEQAERDEAQVIDEMLRVDDALGEVVEVLGDRQKADDRRARSGRPSRRTS